MNEAHIKIIDLNFGYKKSKPIIENLNMNIPKGSIYGFLGRNGAGKTTTIRNMLGLLKPNSGSILFGGKPVAEHSGDLFRKVGSLIENPSIYEHLSGIDNLRLVCKYFSIPSYKISIVLEKVGLTHAATMKSKKYSTGMKQRLGLAMALIHDPELLVLDEPIRGLDPSGIQEIRQLILNINADGTTVLLSSHILSEIEKLVSHVGILNNGMLSFEGTYQELMNHINSSTRLLIRSKNQEALFNYLQDKKEIARLDSWIAVSNINDSETAQLIKELSNKDFDVYEFKKESNNLESIFLGSSNLNLN